MYMCERIGKYERRRREYKISQMHVWMRLHTLAIISPLLTEDRSTRY